MIAHKPVVLVILDGFGYRKDPRYNAIQHARTPHLDFLFATYPHTLLNASGSSVGLLPNFMGNSEVGHLTIGSGRVIQQPITRLHEAITNGSFFENTELKNALATIKEKNTTLHIMGLLSDGGVHSYDEDLYAFLRAAKNAGLTKIVVHAFLDGRDTPPQSASLYLEELDKILKELRVGSIGSLHGRWFAMDRDYHWERTAACYATLTNPVPSGFSSWRQVLEHYYAENSTDEFVPPTALDSIDTKNSPLNTYLGTSTTSNNTTADTLNLRIKDGDGIIFFNYRPDRARQLTRLFLDPTVSDKVTTHPKLSFFLTPVSYGLPSALNQKYMLATVPVPNTLKEVLVANDKTIFTIAETEKYAHVTYFFCGGKEEALSNEIRLLIPSIAAKTYVDHPAMSAALITESVLKSLEKSARDFYLINYANADMVGHSGNFAATVKAIECLDEQIAQLYEAVVEKKGGTLLITADHGNAELMADPETGSPLTAHTTNPVPFVHVDRETKHSTQQLALKELADIAPYILTSMNLPVPSEMTQRTLHDY